MTSPFFLNGEPITILSRTITGRDGDGNDVYTDVSSTVTGAFDEGGSTEIVNGQDTVTSTPTAYLPTGTVVLPTDRVVARGDKYEVDGTANSPTSPLTGWAPGVVVKLKRGTG